MKVGMRFQTRFSNGGSVVGNQMGPGRGGGSSPSFGSCPTSRDNSNGSLSLSVISNGGIDIKASKHVGKRGDESKVYE